MDLTPSDWMRVSPTQWIGMASGGFMGMTPQDWMDMTAADWIERSPSEWIGWMYGPEARRVAHNVLRGRGWHERGCRCDDCRHRRGEDECPRCAPDPCHCHCCVGDVDLVVHARLGELRVIPIRIENERRREKQITLELSRWATRGGKDVGVETVSPTESQQFTLAPCESHDVFLVVKIGERGQGREQQQPPDVDECVVAIADLRLVGCDHRAVRIAIAVLPRDCDPFTVPCGCSCCG